MEKVIPLIKSLKTIFYIKIFELENIQFGLNKIWTGLIWIRIRLNRLEPVLTTGRHCAGVPPIGAPIPALPHAEARYPPAGSGSLPAAHRSGRGPLPIPSAALRDPKPGPPPLLPFTVTALKGATVNRRWWGHRYFGYNHSFCWDTLPYHTITSTTIKSSGKHVLMLLRL
jgi:hypothetical protein